MTKRISTNATLQALKPQDKEYSIPDKKVEGLNIRVRPTGTMTWIFRFQVGKKHEKISMGRYIKIKPERGMTLDQARKEAGRYRSWLENAKNPKVELDIEKRAQDEAKTFDDAFISFDEKRLSKQLRGDQSRTIYYRDIKPIRGKEVGDYYNYFNLKEAVSTLQRNTHGAVFDTITTKTFDTYSMAFSGAELANKFDVLVAPLLQKIEANVRQNIELATLRDILLPKLLSGEIEL